MGGAGCARGWDALAEQEVEGNDLRIVSIASHLDSVPVFIISAQPSLGAGPPAAARDSEYKQMASVKLEETPRRSNDGTGLDPMFSIVKPSIGFIPKSEGMGLLSVMAGHGESATDCDDGGRD